MSKQGCRAFNTSCLSSSVLAIGTITKWIGARAGGKTNQLSSEWAIIRPHISLVLTHQEVA